MKFIIIISIPLVMILHSIIFSYIRSRFLEKKPSEIMRDNIGKSIIRKN